MGKVIAVCTSETKGIQKTEAPQIELQANWGIVGDAHAGAWHRQVSLLSHEKIEGFKALGANVASGAFGENIVVEGFDLKSLPIGTRFRIFGADGNEDPACACACAWACAGAGAGTGAAHAKPIELELTQIGKECHAHCAIYHEMGDCIMPREGVFCRVTAGGTVRPGDTIEVVPQPYFDNAATTQIRSEVVAAMMPYLTGEYGNPSSIYGLGQRASDAVADARAAIAGVLNASPQEIHFTSGGSEADNWAVKGAAHAAAARGEGRHVITSAIEHHAVLHACQALEREGFEVTYLPVDGDGLVCVEDFEAAIRPDTVLATIMFANNEIGTVEPIAELAKTAHRHGVAFHTDAVQAFCHEDIDVEALGVDMLSASAHKLYGPKGVGLLYIRKGVRVENLIDGGLQERGRRAGTENVAGIVGFGEAVRLASAERAAQHARQTELRDHAISRILSEIPHARLNGSRTRRLPGNVNVSFEFVEGEGMILQMAARGISISSGSACTSGSLDPSHVLLAIGLPHEVAHGSVRMTLGRLTTREDVDRAVDSLAATVNLLRQMSPLYEDYRHGKVASLIDHEKEGGSLK